MKHGGFRAIGNKKHTDAHLVRRNMEIPLERVTHSFPVAEANEVRVRIRRVSTRIGIVIYHAKEP